MTRTPASPDAKQATDRNLRDIDPSRRTAARVAGWTCLGLMATAVFAYYFVNPRYMVAGDAAATARNIVAHEGLVRATVACYVITAAGTVGLLTALYALLAPVHRNLALLAAFFRLIFALSWIFASMDVFRALRVLVRAPEYLGAFPTAQLQALARHSIAGGFEAYYVGLPFYGLASTFCAWLWLKSGYVPRALALFGVIASAWCVASAFAFILVPGFGKAVDPYWFDSPMGGFEMAISVWLIVKGVRRTGLATDAA